MSLFECLPDLPGFIKSRPLTDWDRHMVTLRSIKTSKRGISLLLWSERVNVLATVAHHHIKWSLGVLSCKHSLTILLNQCLAGAVHRIRSLRLFKFAHWFSLYVVRLLVLLLVVGGHAESFFSIEISWAKNSVTRCSFHTIQQSYYY